MTVSNNERRIGKKPGSNKSTNRLRTKRKKRRHGKGYIRIEIKTEKGFLFIEIAIVMALVTILVSESIPHYKIYVARQEAREQEVETIRQEKQDSENRPIGVLSETTNTKPTE